MDGDVLFLIYLFIHIMSTVLTHRTLVHVSDSMCFYYLTKLLTECFFYLTKKSIPKDTESDKRSETWKRKDSNVKESMYWRKLF